MNQIPLGPDAGIDTDEMQYWFVVPGVTLKESRLIHVLFKNGKEAILRGEAKAVFNEWASLIEQRSIPLRSPASQDTEQIIDRIIDKIISWTGAEYDWRGFLRECFEEVSQADAERVRSGNERVRSGNRSVPCA